MKTVIRLRRTAFCLLFIFIVISCGKKTETEVDKQTTKTDTVPPKTDPVVESVFANVSPVESDPSAIAPVEFRSRLNEVFMEYTHLKQALVKADSTDAIMQTNQLKKSLTNIKGETLSDKLKKDWEVVNDKIKECCKAITSTENIDKQRKNFSKITAVVSDIVKKFGLKGRTVYFLHCGDKKAGNWMADTKDISNPYLGLTKPEEKPCVEVKEALKFE
jgi:Cu(I)/Ag(I) efflux system membrane fusion protein